MPQEPRDDPPVTGWQPDSSIGTTHVLTPDHAIHASGEVENDGA